MIVGEVKRYLRDNNSIRISRSLKDLAYKALKLKEELTNRNGKEPTLEEIGKILEIDEIEILVALDALREPVSMFEPIYNDGGDTIYLADQLESKSENARNWDISISLDDAIEQLKNKERQILIDRFIVGKTQMEIADEIGISQAQVSRLEKNAIDHVKKLVK
jgi:RNA polymerase sporulation-specific sigma factor